MQPGVKGMAKNGVISMSPTAAEMQKKPNQNDRSVQEVESSAEVEEEEVDENEMDDDDDEEEGEVEIYEDEDRAHSEN